MIKKFLYIFIPFLAVLLMSHNSYAAVNTSLPLNSSTITYQGNPYSATNFVSGSTSTYNSTTGYNIGKNELNYLQFSIPEYIKYTDFNSYVLNFRLVTGYNFTPVSNNNYPISDYYITQNECTDIIEFTIGGSSSSQQGGYTQNLYGDIYDNATQCYTVVIKGKLRGSASTNGIFVLGRWNEHSRLLQYFSGVLPTDSTFPNTYILSPELKLFISEEESAADYALEKEKAQTQDAANNSQSSGSSSQTDSQSATSSLLSVITAGVGAITSASPTNCQINGNMGNLNVGNIDLCANPVPTFMSLIGSIIAVLVVLPLVIVLFNRFISIIRSFQR